MQNDIIDMIKNKKSIDISENILRSRYVALSHIQKKLLKQYWECMCPGCSKKAINTHYLQQHGILDEASISHTFYELKYIDPNLWLNKDIKLAFQKRGISQAISYPVFCRKHDDQLFRPIEKKGVDFNDYRNQLLLSYRTICGEIRKFEICLSSLLNSINNPELPFNKGISEQAYIYMRECSWIEQFRDDIVDEINNPLGKFHFEHFTYPKLDVYSSGLSSLQFEVELPNAMWVDYSLLLFFVIPQKNTLEIIIGFSLHHPCREYFEYIRKWRYLDKYHLGLMLTELFINGTENFGIGKELFERISPEKKDKFCQLAKESLSNKGSNINVITKGFNLFEEVY